jgi:hypothetical protein
VLEAARENGMKDAVGRLSRSVIQAAETGLWIGIATGVGASVIAALLGRVGAAKE